MRFLPILFSTEMVKAILDGRKTVTRRIVKPQPVLNGGFWELGGAGWSDTITSLTPIPCHSLYNRMPYKPDDIMYVRETWAHVKFGLGEWHYEYRADCEDPKRWSNGSFAEWRPSIHMPKEAARLFLRVTDVRAEMLQSIKTDGCVDEGAVMKPHYTKRGDLCLHSRYKTEFSILWDSTIKKSDIDRYGWEANPWVWAISFERCEKPEGWC